MVCMDGFVLTHAMEEIEIVDKDLVNKFLPPFVPRQSLDPNEPVSIGAMVGPEAFTEVKYLGHFKQVKALEVIPEISKEFKELFGRSAAGENCVDGLITEYMLDDAEIMLVALGSVLGSIKDVVDEERERGIRVGVMGITSFRPFPIDLVRKRLKHAQKIVVIERAFSAGIGGIVSSNIRTALSGIDTNLKTVVAGLGGRPITLNTIKDIIEKALYGELEDFSFADLNVDLVQREVERNLANRKSGPLAENLLKDLGGAQ